MLLVSAAAFATAQRTFVSSAGLDTNTCARDQPCRSFSIAIGQTNASGEVIALDSAGYGPVTITQAASIIAPLGVYAGVSVVSGTGITVNAGVTSPVTIRNININSQGGATGIDLQSALALFIDHCTVTGFSLNGINLLPGNTADLVSISDTVVTLCGQSGIYADLAMLAVDHCRLERNHYGIAVDRVTATVRNCEIVKNFLNGILARGSGGAATMFITDTSIFSTEFNNVELQAGSLSLMNCTIANGFEGLLIDAGTARIARNLISGNNTGVDNSGTVNSIGDNLIDGNVSNFVGLPIAPITGK